MSENSELCEYPQTRVEWKIKNFLNLPKKDKYLLKSPSFSLSKVKWHLQLYPNRGFYSEMTGYLNFSLNIEEVTAEYRIAFMLEIKKIDGSMFKSQELERTFKKNGDRLGFDFDRSVLFDSKDSMAWDGILTVFVNIRFVDKILVSPTTASTFLTQSSKAATIEVASQILLPEDIPNLSKDLKELYLSKRFTDVAIKVKSKEFSAHINILAARSAVFASMFYHDTEEKKSGRIEILDCDPDTFEYFLLFLYSGNFNDIISSNAVNLYEISDKYDVQELKEKCVRLMTDTLTVDSFCDVLHLATMHNDSQLLKAALNFFSNNTREIMITKEWHAFISENPLLCNELLLKCFTK